MMKTALITGITGQDGAYLAKLLIDKNYKVYGLAPRRSSDNHWRLRALKVDQEVHFIEGDLTDLASLIRAMKVSKADEVYNLGAQSYVATSWEQPILTAEVTAIGVVKLLEAIRLEKPEAKFYQASTSEMFGKIQHELQVEETPFYPRSPYGFSKLFGHWATINYRESFNIHASNGILFNHESPLRGEEFVTRKITRALARIKYKQQATLELGNMESKRDWGFAGDYVKGMWLMLQQEKPDDYVLATGETHSVKEFVEYASQVIGFDLEWQGSGETEKAIDTQTGDVIVKVNKDFFRPAEVDLLIGSPNKAKESLNWQPEITFKKLVEMMAEADLKSAKI